MIVDEVACGYIASFEQMAECGEAQNIKYEILMLKVKVLSWLETILRRAPPIFAPYPRKANTYSTSCSYPESSTTFPTRVSLRHHMTRNSLPM